MRGAPQVGFSAIMRKIERSGDAPPDSPLCGRLGAEPASAKPNTIESGCDASGQPSRVSPRLRVCASRTTVVAGLPITADRGRRAEDGAVEHARPVIAVATPDSPG